MARLSTTAAFAVVLALAGSGCARNRDLPTQLAPSRVTTIGVNSYLWRAAIDTNPKAPGERVKLTVSILDQDLRADALRVAAARQVSQNGAWIDAPVSASTVQKLEDIILTRARDIRRTSVGG
jgi:hypothetical protein